MFSAALGLSHYVVDLRFPDEMMALVVTMPPDWITISTSLLLPFILIVTGTFLAFGKLRAAYILATVYVWYFAVFVWGVVADISKHLDIPFLIAVKSPITWGLIGGAILYGILAYYSVTLSKNGPQYNKS